MPDLATPPAALLPHSPGLYVAVTLAGFAIGILGHLTRTRWLVAAGLALIFLGALVFPFVTHLTSTEHPPPLERGGGAFGE